MEIIDPGKVPRTPREAIDWLGVERIAAEMGVSERTVLWHRSAERLPASWYAALQSMTDRTLPLRLFSFKGAMDKGADE